MRYLLLTEEMVQLEQRTITEIGLPALTLMETAGRGVAHFIHRTHCGREPCSVLIVCGKGNNGGDGLVIARVLDALGYTVEAYIVGTDKSSALSPSARHMYNVLQKSTEVEVKFIPSIENIHSLAQALVQADLCIDAMLGTGQKGPLREPIAAAVQCINNAGTQVVAVDLPTGVNTDTGTVSPLTIRAESTATFAHLKRGHALYPGAGHCGHVEVIDIGIPQRLSADLNPHAHTLDAHDGPTLLPKRSANAHKGSLGHLFVWAGCSATPGAAILALRAALRAGTGKVSWMAEQSTVNAAPPFPPEVMLRPLQILKDTAHNALLIGPGLGTDATAVSNLEKLLCISRTPLCLDADALNILAREIRLWPCINVPVVITPHVKEMARLIGKSVADVQADRCGVAQEFAATQGCTVVLKGPGTIVAEPGGRIFVSRVGGPALATAGTGDVLAGLIGGFLAQGLDASVAARAGVLVHGLAGDLATKEHGIAAVIASDVVKHIGTALRQWKR